MFYSIFLIYFVKINIKNSTTFFYLYDDLIKIVIFKYSDDFRYCLNDCLNKISF